MQALLLHIVLLVFPPIRLLSMYFCCTSHLLRRLFTSSEHGPVAHRSCLGVLAPERLGTWAALRLFVSSSLRLFVSSSLRLFVPSSLRPFRQALLLHIALAFLVSAFPPFRLSSFPLAMTTFGTLSVFKYRRT